MLNFFLVLGLIPGTNLVFTFNEIIFVMFALAAFLYLRATRRTKMVIRQEIIQLSRLHSFSFPMPTLEAPEGPTHHKAEVLRASIYAQRLVQAARRFRLSV